jgi:hypothetical protein
VMVAESSLQQHHVGPWTQHSTSSTADHRNNGVSRLCRLCHPSHERASSSVDSTSSSGSAIEYAACSTPRASGRGVSSYHRYQESSTGPPPFGCAVAGLRFGGSSSCRTCF